MADKELSKEELEEIAVCLFKTVDKCIEQLELLAIPDSERNADDTVKLLYTILDSDKAATRLEEFREKLGLQKGSQ